MLKAGHALISDDLTILRRGTDGGIEVVPGAARMHLWEDAAQGVGFRTDEASRHPLRRAKAAVTPPGEPCRVPQALRRLYILEPATDKNIRTQRLKGADKFNALLGCIYGPLLGDEHPGLFPLFSATAEKVEIFVIRRPGGRWTVDEIVKVVRDG
jgi:hypothetical protein